MNTKNLSIILPVYNEKESISLMVKILHATLNFEHEILIVYDDEKDTSIPEAKKLQEMFSNIKLIHNTMGKGAKYAVMTGVQNSRFENILITCADEIFPIIAIEKMLTMLVDNKCDFVSGTRYKNGGKRLGGSFIGHLLSRLANKSFSLITNFPLSDLTTGIKMFKKNTFQKIEINSPAVGWVWTFELTIKAYLLNLKMGEVPLISIDRIFGGISTFKVGSWIKEYFKLYLWGFFEIYKKKIKRS